MLTDEKQAIKDWLRLDKRLKGDCCPFYQWDPRSSRPCNICEEWFPNIINPPQCPCSEYELADVIKTARKMVRDAEK